MGKVSHYANIFKARRANQKSLLLGPLTFIAFFSTSGIKSSLFSSRNKARVDPLSKHIKRPAVKIFYSYAHTDAAMQEKLHDELKNLSQSKKFKISQWYDGCIRPGTEFEESIAKNLKRADIILLLLTPAFVDSEYCYEKELEWALQQHKKGVAKIIPVLVKEVAWRDRAFSPFEAIPRGKRGARPITKWKPQSAALTKIREQLNQEIRELIAGGLATDVRKMSRDLQSVAAKEIDRVSSGGKTIDKQYDSVMQFWADKQHLREGDLIEINGTFSEFAPLVIGYPKAKRMLHMEYRRALEKNRRLGKKKIRTLNACMSISAGQMVYRDRNATETGVFCGLYESIIRNAIPLFVVRDYYESSLRPMMLKRSKDTFEAKVVGRVTKRKMRRLKKFIEKYGMTSFISQKVIDDLCKDSFGLLVNGEGTSISYLGRSKYLDGDVWIAGEQNGVEFFETAFLDIGDPNDREDALVTLREKLEDRRGKPRLVAQYDEVSPLLQTGIGTEADADALEKIFRYGLDPA
jgi:hypothetical protein